MQSGDGQSPKLAESLGTKAGGGEVESEGWSYHMCSKMLNPKKKSRGNLLKAAE